MTFKNENCTNIADYILVFLFKFVDYLTLMNQLGIYIKLCSELSFRSVYEMLQWNLVVTVTNN